MNTELYAGVKVWNRMDVTKDPITGRRVPVMKPQSTWKRTGVPHLRIVDQPLWDRVRARKDQESDRAPAQLMNRRKPGILSGLFKCGCCGAAYTSYSKTRLACAAHRETGDSICAHRRMVDRQAIERRVLEGLQARMLTPYAVAAYVRAYHQAYDAQLAEDRARVAPLQRRLGELCRTIERLVDAICDGSSTPAMRQRLNDLESEKPALEASVTALSAEADNAPIALHPGAASAYARKVTTLQTTLSEISGDPDQAQANRKIVDAVRGLVESIVLTPQANGEIGVTLHGNLAVLLKPSEPVPFQRTTGSLVVAGARYITSQPSRSRLIRLRY